MNYSIKTIRVGDRKRLQTKIIYVFSSRGNEARLVWQFISPVEHNDIR